MSTWIQSSSEVLSEILESPKLTSELSNSLLQETNKCLNYYLPGLLSGLWSFPELKIRNERFECSNTSPLMTDIPPFVYQGDSM